MELIFSETCPTA